VQQVVPHNGDLKLMLVAGTSPQDVLRTLVTHDVPVEKFEIALPTLDEVFIRVVEEGADHA